VANAMFHLLDPLAIRDVTFANRFEENHAIPKR